MTQEWIEVRWTGMADAGEVLGLLNDPAVAGAWQEDGQIRLYWPSARWSPDALASLKQILSCLGDAGTAISVDRLPAQDWNEQWARSVKPIRIGQRIVIRPSWERASLAPSDIELILDPKQAFGTGHHATTAVLLEWLERVIHGGERILDVGTGSGILAMAAVRLGAKTAMGIDCDPVAIECAREYASVNGFGGELDLRVATLDAIESGPMDIVLANLDRHTLLESARFFEPFLKQGARLLMSGILPEDRSEIAAAFAAVGGAVAGSQERDGWLALDILKPDSCEGGA
ncbi:MAG TPA: 50S ribosomal protein L11 methyltransferase [Nitrospiraceae bacterium]|nr:50S ribosomal protein L11 methyltransferase [Nitrospiraceae bacterium]